MKTVSNSNSGKTIYSYNVHGGASHSLSADHTMGQFVRVPVGCLCLTPMQGDSGIGFLPFYWALV